MLKKIILILFFSANIYCNTLEYNPEFYNEREIGVSVIHLDYIPIYKTSFLLNSYVPNHIGDYKIYDLYINGSRNTPIYNMIPNKLYFNPEHVGFYSQLSYKQKKSEDYFNIIFLSAYIL